MGFEWFDWELKRREERREEGRKEEEGEERKILWGKIDFEYVNSRNSKYLANIVGRVARLVVRNVDYGFFIVIVKVKLKNK